MHAKSTTSPNLSVRSDADLLQWGAEILTRWRLQHEFGYHLVVWSHDDWCPQQPDNRAHDLSRCRCQPDAAILLHVATPHERRVEVVRDGIPLPIPRRAGHPDASPHRREKR